VTVSSVATLAAVLSVAPALPGLANRTKSFLTGRRGAPVLQLYSDLAKLARKGAVYSGTTTSVFRVAPVVAVVSTLLAACLLPLDGREPVVGFTGDIVLFAALLALGRFALVLAALDTGSSFEGMGASREVTFTAFAEPGLFLCLLALVLATGRLSLGGVLAAPLASAWPTAAPSLVMVGISLFVLMLAEASRVPVDNPATHLELTMIHEVMVLDHSGPDLALILYGGALKLALFGSLVVGVLVPRGALDAPAGGVVLVAGLLGVAAGVGVVESVMARLRLDRVPQFLITASALAGFAAILLLR
jgi:formate hydrogenlyase subunit 4